MTPLELQTAKLVGRARILVVDDEAPIRHFLKIALGAGGLEIIEAETGKRGIELAATSEPDAIVLDLGLPDIDGKSVIAAVREWSSAPILVLSVRDGEAEKIEALDAGADDYVTKPFATGELMARLRALLRKRGDRTAGSAEFSAGPIRINFPSRVVRVGETEVKLTRKQFDVLTVLARTPAGLSPIGTS